MLKLATVFSGIGAIEHALDRMNIEHKIVFASDNGGVDLWKGLNADKIKQKKEELLNINDEMEKKKRVDEWYKKTRKTNYVKQTYFHNYEIKQEDWYEDVEFLNGNVFRGQVDLFVGGSPCQSFSLAGKQGGLEDTRGTLFYQFARLVKEIQPKVFIYENVKGMLTHDKGKTWSIIKNVFDELGYTYYYQILNAKEYGIPQNRNRLFVVGFKEKVDFQFPKERELTKTMQDFLEENTSNLFYIKEKQKNRKSVEIESKYFLSDKIKGSILSSGTKNFYMKPETDLKIARPLLSTMHKMHRAGTDNYVTTNGRLRRLTPREALRLMGFCDSFEQVISDTQMYRQAGNSIVVDVLIAIMGEIIKTVILHEV